jgi:hypothetical protein
MLIWDGGSYLRTLDHGGEGVRVVGEVADHEGHEDGRRVVAGDEGDHGGAHDFLLAQQPRAVFVRHAEQARDEVVAAPRALHLVPRDPFEHPPRPRAGLQAPRERRERQVHRDGPHALHHAREVLREGVPDGAALQAEQQRRDDVEREALHQRHHRDGPPPGPAVLDVAPHLAVDPADVHPQHVGLEELGERAADALVVGAAELQDAPLPEDPTHGLGLKKTNLLAAGPVTSTVGVPNSDSFDTGPYRLTRDLIHRSAVLLRMARRRPRLWPITGRPREPGGRRARRGFLDLLTRWRMTGIAMATSARRRHRSIWGTKETSYY